MRWAESCNPNEEHPWAFRFWSSWLAVRRKCCGAFFLHGSRRHHSGARYLKRSALSAGHRALEKYDAKLQRLELVSSVCRRFTIEHYDEVRVVMDCLLNNDFIISWSALLCVEHKFVNINEALNAMIARLAAKIKAGLQVPRPQPDSSQALPTHPLGQPDVHALTGD